MSGTSSPPPRPNTLLRVALWYLGVAAVLGVVWFWLPQFIVRLAATHSAASLGAADSAAAALRAAAELRRPIVIPGAGPAGWTLAPTVIVAMVVAVVFAMPVAWVYVLTRAKRGYQQSVVQTMVILPMVVAGVVTLVKDSLPLAFSLAGIVAAVRFRTALDDSKDAVYVFVATGIGLAAAVDLPVAAAISVVFNAVILLLWRTDFGRTPAHLEGSAAERRMKRAMERLTKTGSFVARVDDELLREMTAEQLRAVSDRAARRARENDPDAGPADSEERREMRMRVRTYDVADARRAVEPLLDSVAKRWHEASLAKEGDGAELLEYVLVLRKSRAPEELAAQVRAAGAPHVIGVELT
jgi:hypothetical protein